MQKNYLLSNAELTTNPLKSTSEKGIQKNIVTTCLLTLFILLGFSDVFGQSPFVDNNTAGPNTFTVPAGVTSITINLWGGGGAGGGNTTTDALGGSGGGSGGYTTRTYTGLVGGEIINYTLGSGGTGSTGNGTNGGTSTLTFGGFTLTANGGTGGGANQGAIGTGGTATGGTTNTTGNLGLIGTTSGGNGGNAPAGGGTGGNGSTNAAGNPGNAPGGGGGGGERANTGGSRDRAGGNGGSGGIQITFTCPTFTAGTDQTLATCATTATLAAAALPSGTTGAWTVIAGTATVTTPSSPTSGVTGIVPGTPVTLRWTVTNGACGSSFDDVVITSPVGPGCTVVLVSGAGTNNITCGTNAVLKDHAGDANYANNRNDWSVINAGLGATITLSGTYTTENTWDFVRIYDGSGIAGTLLATYTGTGTINYVGTPGQTLTLQFTSDVSNVASGFVVNVSYSGVCFPVCTTPIAQPTTLNLAPAGTTLNGSFTAALPASDSYLVLISTNPAAPAAPVNGSTYAIGSTYQVGYTVVDNDTNTSFVASGLTPLTTYYFYIYSFNGLCTGGPFYLGTSPLTGNATTLTANYCIPSYSNTFYPPVHYIRRVSFVGTLQDTDNPSSYDTTTPYGYEDFTSLTPSIQAQGEGVNIYMESTFSGYYKAWVDWNQDGDFLDAGEDVYDVGGIAQSATTFGFVVPPATPPGNYRVRLRMSGRNGAGADGGFAWNACTTNVAYSGEAEDYILTVVASCNSIISDVTDGVTCGAGTVNLAAVGLGSPSEFRWYTTETGGLPIATTATGNWTTPAIGTTTTYWVTCFNGCESLVRTKVIAYVNPVATISFTPSVPEVCGENNVLSLTAAGDVQQTFLVDEHFTSGLGVMTNQNIVSNGADDTITQWQTQTSTFVPAQQTWYPAISSGLSGNAFAMATSDVGPVTTHNAILSPTVNTNTYLNLTLSFDIFHSRYYVDGTNTTLEYITVDVSTNGGGAWIEIDRYLADIGYGTRFENRTYDLSAYINEPNFRVRIRYYGEWCDGLAIDNFQLFGDVPLNTAFEWSAVTPVEAFTDAACTTSYVAGTPITTVYIRPTLSQLEGSVYEFTATATLTNGCAVSQNVMIDNKSKVWKGGTNGDWNNPNNWSPVGVPDANTCVIIPPATNTSNVLGTNYNGFGRTLQVIDGGTLTINPTNTVTITDFVEVRGATSTFNIENSASLIQVNNVANIGNVNSKRIAVTNSTLDYVYWSTPVAGFSVNNITPSSTYRYAWNPTVNNGGTYLGNFGNWVAASGAMTTGRGYIIRGSSGNTTFAGVPNNGNITIPITRGTYTSLTNYAGPTATPVTRDDDNWNLLGNPYPSALSADAFLTANLANLAPSVKIWTHGIDPAAIADPFYQDYQLNYNTNDYITYNRLGGTQAGFDGYIGSGQGFFVLMNDAGATTENAVFNNTMRSNAFRNDQFYRTSEDLERHRIWLKIISPTNTTNDMLVGYTSEATNGFDSIFDTKHVGVKTNFELYSLIEDNGYIIQGRALPFNNSDEIPLGLSVPQNGIYTIAIDAVDGLFNSSSQDIFLEDKALGITHNLRATPYSFTANTGRFDNRFVLKFKNETLSNEDFTTNTVMVYANDNINVAANNQTIKSVRVHDLLGRILGTFNNVNSNTFETKNIAKTQSALLVEVTLDNGSTKTYKVIF